jgi:flavin-dependent dehydrogenase
MFEYDVLIVGAGLAGLTAAVELSRAGHTTLLVDARQRAEGPVHTTGIFVRRTLEDFVLPEGCLGPGIRRVVLHSPAGRIQVIESGRDEFRVGRMGLLYSRLLAEGVAHGVEWSPGTRYRSSRGIPGGSAVWLEKGGSRWRVRARVLVGADGAVSRVAGDLGLEGNRDWIVGLEDVFEGTLGHGVPEMHCVIDPGIAPGYIGWLVDDGESVHAGVGGNAARFEPSRALGELRARFGSLYSGLSKLRRTERRGGRIPVNGVLDRIGCDRGVLIGDAAGAVSPMTAGGLDPCLRLTRLATRLIGAVLGGESSSTLELYSGRPFQKHFARRRATRSLLSAVHHGWQAEAICGFLRTPPGRSLARRIFFGRGSFPDIDLAFRGDFGRPGRSGGPVTRTEASVSPPRLEDPAGRCDVGGYPPRDSFLQGHRRRR